MNLLDQTLQHIRPIDPQWIHAASRRQLELTKPPGSLGRLEEIANRCAAIRESFALTADRPRIVIFAADHGVCAEGSAPIRGKSPLRWSSTFFMAAPASTPWRVREKSN
jgi:NaMN:DMB phosphoribosyltransferase